MINSDKSFLYELLTSSLALPDCAQRDNISLARDNLRTALDAFYMCGSRNNMRALNGAWALAERAWDQNINNGPKRA